MKYVLYMKRSGETRVSIHSFPSNAAKAAQKHLEGYDGPYVSGSHFQPADTVERLVQEYPEWEIHIFACELERGPGYEIV